MKILMIDRCIDCKYCSYDKQYPDYKGVCIRNGKFTIINEIYKIPRWCPLDNVK